MARKLFSGVSELSKVVSYRRDDAQALFKQERWRGAMYMAGYAVECLIKTKLMKMFDQNTLAGLEAELKRRRLISEDSSLFDHRIELYLRALGRFDALKDDIVLWRAFNIANRWIPSWRYNPDLSNLAAGKEFLSAVDTMLKWMTNNI